MQQLSNFGIGASEIAAIAGLNPYHSPWDVWLRKTGQTVEDPQTTFTEWGHRLEPAIRQAYVDQTGHTVHVPSTSMFHAETPWARATPDGLVVKEPHTFEAVVQCKNVGTWVEKAWRDAPPQYVQLQEHWEMYVTGLERSDIAVLIGGNDFRVYTVHRDDKLIEGLVTIAAEFWGRVQTKQAPNIDGSDACSRYFEERLTKAGAVELVADASTDASMVEWSELHHTAKRCERRIKEIKNAVLADLVGAKADRVTSQVGTAKLRKTGGGTKTTTNWELVAQLCGTNVPEYAAIVAANTTTTESPSRLSLYPPREWGKESE
jgi:putative phage-type endonuclease